MPRPPKRISHFDVCLGTVVKSKRVKRKLSQADLSDQTGIPLSNLKRREDGSNESTVSELERIAHALDVAAHELVDEALADFGGIDKLIEEERAAVSPAEHRVTDAEDAIPYIGQVRPPARVAADTKPRIEPKE